MAGTMAALGTLVALHARERTGQGQVVDSAIYEAVLAYMESMLPEYHIGGYIRERTGSILPNVAPSSVYPTSDGQMILIAASHDIYRAPEMLADPHFNARDAIAWMKHPDFGEFPMQNVVPKLSETPGAVRWLGPELGEHNEEVLHGLLGLDRERAAAAMQVWVPTDPHGHSTSPLRGTSGAHPTASAKKFRFFRVPAAELGSPACRPVPSPSTTARIDAVAPRDEVDVAVRTRWVRRVRAGGPTVSHRAGAVTGW
jgi:hypothetical protein